MPDARLPLLLLHPAAALSAVWMPFRRAWADRWPILAPDLLPHDAPASQLQRWAAASAAQLAALGDRPAHVVGASLGASVALRLALDHPERVASLTLDSAQLGGPPPAALFRHIGRGVAALARRLPARLLAAALLTQFVAYRGADRAAVRADMLRLGAAGIIGQLRAQFAHDVRMDVGRISVPILLLAGTRDPLTRSGAHQALHAALGGSRLVLVTGAGHVSFLSHPEALMRELPRQLAAGHNT